MFVCFLFNVLVADDFRIFCGDLGNEVNDDILARAFSRYPSFLKAKVGSLLLISATLQGSDGSDETKKEQRSTGVLVPWACYSPVRCIMRTSRPAPRRKREKQTWWKPKLWHLVLFIQWGILKYVQKVSLLSRQIPDSCSKVPVWCFALFQRESIVDKICCSHQVVRDKRTGKTKGYGFVSFKDPNDYVRAMREMNGQSLHMHYTLSPACALTI